MTRRYSYYTTAELKTIERMSKEGVKRSVIAEEVNKPYNSVCMMISTRGWYRDEFNLTPTQLGRIFMSVSNNALSLELTNTPKHISQTRYQLRLKLTIIYIYCKALHD